jgi:uncharacterized membrane protein YkoI
MRAPVILMALMGLCVSAALTEKNLALQDLPPAVRKTIQAELQGGRIKGIHKETEHGVAQYEVESMLNGKHRDFNVDTQGALLLVEEETTLDSVPATAQAAIRKKVADGKITMVELYIRRGETLYEAGYTSKNGKKHEVLVNASGVETPE